LLERDLGKGPEADIKTAPADHCPQNPGAHRITGGSGARGLYLEMQARNAADSVEPRLSPARDLERGASW